MRRPAHQEKAETITSPNYIEKSLSLTEDKLNGELDWFLHTVLGMRPSDRPRMTIWIDW